jgi:ketosteroid isomerase-like protein
VVTRAQAIADCKSAAVPIVSFDMDDIAVRVFGDAAVVTGRTTVTTGGATPATVRLRFTDVFSRRSGTWLVVASHATQLK